ncbi:MAG: hypothetical protein M0Z95_26815 [Actinomycetota bacterium]|nr:hypothetical protein [Actinomycetota bacterium]
MCADITGNSIAGSAQAGQGGADFELDQTGGTAFELPGYTGTSTNTTAVTSFVQAANAGNGTPTGIATVGGGGGFIGGGGCAAP